jgi:hypothetical protein
MGAPLRSRNSFTWAAEMFVVSVLMKIDFLQFERALQHTTRVVVAPRGPKKRNSNSKLTGSFPARLES